MINENRLFCYRILHIDNLELLLKNGIVTKNHTNASKNYIEIGNYEIIDVRSSKKVKIDNYGMIGDYVPFYFTPKSIMLYNIITGYRAPIVAKRKKNEIIVIRCLINELTKLTKWFFSDGQCNDMATNHYNNVKHLECIDWDSIKNGNFKKSDGDFDRPRRYQAEFLVYDCLSIDKIESINVCDQDTLEKVNSILTKNNINLAVNIQPIYFF